MELYICIIGDSKTSPFARGYLGKAAPVFLISQNNNFLFLFFSFLFKFITSLEANKKFREIKMQSREAKRADKDRNVSPAVLFALSKAINLNKKLKKVFILRNYKHWTGAASLPRRIEKFSSHLFFRVSL